MLILLGKFYNKFIKYKMKIDKNLDLYYVCTCDDDKIWSIHDDPAKAYKTKEWLIKEGIRCYIAANM